MLRNPYKFYCVETKEKFYSLADIADWFLARGQMVSSLEVGAAIEGDRTFNGYRFAPIDIKLRKNYIPITCVNTGKKYTHIALAASEICGASSGRRYRTVGVRLKRAAYSGNKVFGSRWKIPGVEWKNELVYCQQLDRYFDGYREAARAIYPDANVVLTYKRIKRSAETGQPDCAGRNWKLVSPSAQVDAFAMKNAA